MKDLSIEIIQKCPNNCLHCSSCSALTSQPVIAYAQICKVVDEFKNLGGKRICLSGGEPFLHPNILDIISYITQAELEVNVYSCGISLDNNECTPIGHNVFYKAKELGLTRIMFNLQSLHESVYDQIVNAKHRFPLVIKSIDQAIAVGLQTEIHFVPMKLNFQEIPDMVQFAANKGIDCVSFLKLVPHGRAITNAHEIDLTQAETIWVQNTLAELQTKFSCIRVGIPLSPIEHPVAHCHAISNKLYIKYDGRIFGCEAFKYINFVEDEKPVLPDSIFECNIDELYQTSDFFRLSKQLIQKYDQCSNGCDTCPVQKYIKERAGDSNGLYNR